MNKDTLLRGTCQAAAISASMLLFGVLPARATDIKLLEFNVDGVFPSTEPDIDFFNNIGGTEADYYAVSAGLLHQSTYSVVGNVSYTFPGNNLMGGGLDSAQAITMEVRMRVLQISGQGVFFQFFDGAHRFTAFLEPTGMSVVTLAGLLLLPLDVSQFHTYRLESTGGSNAMNVFIDGAPAASVVVPTHTLNGFDWGDGISDPGNGAQAEWDYVRVTQVVPEPHGVALLLLGAGLIARRRRS